MLRRAWEVVLGLIDLLSNTYEWRLTELQAELAAERTKNKDLEAKIETDATAAEAPIDVPLALGISAVI
jgi:hypothetical protein